MMSQEELARLRNALPFWLSLGLFPLAVLEARLGGWTVLLVPVVTWWLFTLLDAVTGRNEENADPATPARLLFWYRAVTLVWFPLQAALLIWLLWYVPRAPHLGTAERLGVFLGMGVLSGTIGINYAHELMHQTNRLERWLADLLLASVLYSHFRSEHLLVHHIHVGTPRDAVTARYNEGFPRFFLRVLRECPVSAFRAERARLARAGRPWWDRRNPFWRYLGLQAGFLVLAFALSGWAGVGFFCLQALVAVWQLELVNYVEHYGLVRRPLGTGRYERVQPHHSWNASHRATNWLLINLQRHSDHHCKPDRRFPLLQNHDETAAPQLPFGYPLMGTIAMIPPLWRRVMNPRVRAWRRRHYPDITDWRGFWPQTPPPAPSARPHREPAAG